MYRNQAGQRVTLLVVDRTTNQPATGVAGTLTFYVRKDNGAVVALSTPSPISEVDATNARGLYDGALTQGETDAGKLGFSGKSTNPDLEVIPQIDYPVPSTWDAPPAGAFTISATVNDGVDPVENAVVRLTSGATTLSGTTDANGLVAFSVDAGSWSVAISKQGYSFTPTTLVVAGNASPTWSLSLVSHTPDPDPLKSVVVITCYGPDTLPEPGAVVVLSQRSAPTGVPNKAFDSTPRSLTADGSGVVVATLWRNASYFLKRGTATAGVVFTPTTDVYDVGSVIGSP